MQNQRGKHTRAANMFRRKRQCKLSVEDRLIMILQVLIGSPFAQVARMFNMTEKTVSEDFHHIVPIIVEHLGFEIQYPNVIVRNSLQGTFSDFDNVIGCVDATHTPIRKPLESQHIWYRGDKKIHSVITQLVCDWQGLILHLVVGNCGHNNDKGIFNISDFIVNENEMFNGAQVLLADGGYPGPGRLIIPYNAIEVATDPNRAIFNVVQRQSRVIIENAIGRIKKLWNICSAKLKYDKYFQPNIFYACALLTNRIMRIRGCLRS